MADAVLATHALSKRFGGLAAVNDVSLELRSGEIHAVIGPNGAGKTTLVNLLSGDLKPTGGSIMLGERDVTRLGAEKRGLLGIGRSYQKTMIFPDASVFENVRLAVQAHGAAPLSFRRRAASEEGLREHAMLALVKVGLGDRPHARANALSHGEQRQLEIAMVIATNPKVALLDEPLAGISGADSRAMTAFIGQLRAGRAVLLVEHDMDAVFAVADRLTVMADGKVIASGLPDEVRRHPAVRAAYLGAETVA
jgi:branched-chain amino acid transport system ATP-binding protein